jgi:hypothetical protein
MNEIMFADDTGMFVTASTMYELIEKFHCIVIHISK